MRRALSAAKRVEAQHCSLSILISVITHHSFSDSEQCEEEWLVFRYEHRICSRVPVGVAVPAAELISTAVSYISCRTSTPLTLVCFHHVTLMEAASTRHGQTMQCRG